MKADMGQRKIKKQIPHHEDVSTMEFVMNTVMEHHNSLSAIEQQTQLLEGGESCDELSSQKKQDESKSCNQKESGSQTTIVTESSTTRDAAPSCKNDIVQVGSLQDPQKQQQHQKENHNSAERENFQRVGSYAISGIGEEEEQQEEEGQQMQQQQQQQSQRESHDFTLTSSGEYCVEATKVEDTLLASAKPLEWWTPQKIGCIVLGSLALLAVILSVTLTGRSSTLYAESPTMSPTLSPDARWDKVTEIVGNKTFVNKGNDTIASFQTFLEENPSSPAYKALNWITFEDELRVRVDQVQHLLQRYALAVLYFATGGDTTWADSFEFLTPEHECTWSGALLCESYAATDDDYYYLTTTNSTGNVITGIDLRGNKLNGQIPCELSLLTELQSLVLDGNGLTGNLPTCLQELTALTRLEVYSNKLNGSIPTEYSTMQHLESLSLGRNGFTGRIPHDLGTSLTHLSLERNKLTGPIPDSLWALSRLQYFNAERQSLTGTISPRIGNWTDLKLFHVNKLNGIRGNLPSEIGLLTQLTSLKTTQNHMRGSVPSELGNLQNLVVLALSRNGYSGSLPHELTHLKNLEEVYLQSTWLTGDMDFLCQAFHNGDMSPDLVVLADLAEVNCTCCECCLY